MGRSLLAPVLLLWLSSPVWASDAVYFADPHLKAVVEATLWISDPSPDDMLGLTSLAAEDKGITNLTGLEYALNLERLWIRWNHVSDLSPLAGLTNLRFLDGHGNDVISDVSPLAALTKLQTLILRYNRITDVSALSGLTNLTHLHLEWNNITDISGLSGLTNLQEVSLQYNQFSDISALTGLTNLASLDIRSNPLNADACTVYIPQIIANNPGINMQHNSCAPRHVIFSSTTGGHISDPGEGEFWYNNGEIVFLLADADPGFCFVSFSGTYNTSDNPVSLTVEQDHEIRANFARLGDPNSVEEPPGDPSVQRRVIHVDDDAPDDPKPGDTRVSDPWEDGTPKHPFDGIQEAVNAAADGAIIFVHAGTYHENVDLLGKGVRLTGFDPTDSNAPRWPIIDGNGIGPVVSFTHHEDSRCVLQGCVVTGGGGPAAAILCSAGSPTISNCLIVGSRASEPNGAVVYFADSNAVLANCTIADNHAGTYGVGLSAVNGHVAVSNSILWNNYPAEVLHRGTGGVSITYSDIRGGWPGNGNLTVNPLFAAGGHWAASSPSGAIVEPGDPNAVWVMGDYHLQSRAGRWDAAVHKWVNDPVTSPCIDTGNPKSPVGREMFPNGLTINMGAYGGTVNASKSDLTEFDSGAEP